MTKEELLSWLKPLKWDKLFFSYCDTILGRYNIVPSGRKYYLQIERSLNNGELGVFTNHEEAKMYAQEHYNKLVLNLFLEN